MLRGAERRGRIFACSHKDSTAPKSNACSIPGRTHQIRVHLSHLGHPIWGDTLYGNRSLVNEFYPARQMLHAARIEIAHPISGKALQLEAILPADYIESRERLLN